MTQAQFTSIGMRRPPGAILPLAAAATWACLVLCAQIAGVHPTCLFRWITGTPCATCGGTRATFALLAGHPVHAIVLNPLVTTGLVAAVCWTLLCLFKRALVGASLLHDRRTWALLAVAFSANWMYVVLAGRV